MDKSLIFPAMLQEKVISNLIDICPDGIIGVDLKGMVTIFNQKAAELTQRSVEDVLGKLHIKEIYGSLDRAREIKAAIYAGDNGGRNRLEGFDTEIVNVSGDAIPIRLSAVIFKEDALEIGNVGFFHDQSQRKALEEKLYLLSITDGLTQLFNQRHFYYVLAQEISRTQRYDRPLSLICFDLDNFKNCNDLLGHLEGDTVLRRVGEMLKKITRKSDKAFRYGGDEFFIILPESDREQAVMTAEKIREIFNESWPYVLTGGRAGTVRVTLSIGVIERLDEGAGEALIRRADAAMYVAKREGGDRVVAA